MQKRRLDLNRYKKIYTSKRKSPQFYNKSPEAYGATVDFSNADQGTAVVLNSGVISSTPVATITTTEDVNIWISSISRTTPSDSTSDWTVTIYASAPFTGKVHVLLVEIS